MEERTMFEWADYLKELRDEKADLEARLKEVNARIAEADKNLFEIMRVSDTQNFTHNGTMFCRMVKQRARAVDGRMDDLIDALRAEGHGDMVKVTINSNTLSSFVTELYEANDKKLPEWMESLVTVWDQKNVGVRKATR